MTGKNEAGMTVIVKTITRFTLGFILLYGVYVALSGHRSPGGGFPGGVIVALSFVHVMLAFGKETALKRLNSYVLRLFISIGALLFLYLVMVNFTGNCFPVNLFMGNVASCPLLSNEIAIPISEMVIVGSGLFAIFVVLVLLCKSEKEDN